MPRHALGESGLVRVRGWPAVVVIMNHGSGGGWAGSTHSDVDGANGPLLATNTNARNGAPRFITIRGEVGHPPLGVQRGRLIVENDI